MTRKIDSRWHARGEFAGSAKLRANDVRTIRASSESLAELARRYGVSRNAVSLVRNRRTWKHVDA